MDFQTVIKELERAWDLNDGFLGGLREGVYRHDELERLVNTLRSIELTDPENIDKRLVSLTWFIPIFLTWQKERLTSQNIDVSRIDQAINRIEEVLEKILGTP